MGFLGYKGVSSAWMMGGISLADVQVVAALIGHVAASWHTYGSCRTVVAVMLP